MPTDTNLAEAAHYLDRAAQAARDKGTHLEVVAAIGIGYAMLALVDEIAELRAQLPPAQS